MAAASFLLLLLRLSVSSSLVLRVTKSGGENSLRATKLFNSTLPAKGERECFQSSTDVLLQNAGSVSRKYYFFRLHFKYFSTTTNYFTNIIRKMDNLGALISLSMSIHHEPHVSTPLNCWEMPPLEVRRRLVQICLLSQTLHRFSRQTSPLTSCTLLSPF